jgi:hypothetical protein
MNSQQFALLAENFELSDFGFPTEFAAKPTFAAECWFITAFQTWRRGVAKVMDYSSGSA